MEHKNCIIFSEKIKKLFSKQTLNSIGKDLGLLQRERKITPHRLALAVISTFSCGRIESLADIQRGFNELFNETVAYKPFHNQLTKPEFSEFMRELASLALTSLTVEVLGFKTTNKFSCFEKILLQDGTSFAVNSKLKKIYKGRFTKVSPAAVEIHTTLNLFDGSVEKATLTSDSASERAELPEPESFTGSLLLADRGYPNLDYLSRVDAAGAHFIMRDRTRINPLISSAFNFDGTKAFRHFEGKDLKQVKDRLPKKKSSDLDVEWVIDKETSIKLRLIATWNKKIKEHQYLITNLPRDRFSAEQIKLAYQLRWQIELLFKEWKSHANLHSFNTKKEPIVEGLIWGSIIAATLKRYLAHIAQIETNTAISTHKAAKCGYRFLGNIIDALIGGLLRKIQQAIEAFIGFLMRNAQRSHPKRDERSGRLQTGLQPIFSGLKD